MVSRRSEQGSLINSLVEWLGPETLVKSAVVVVCGSGMTPIGLLLDFVVTVSQPFKAISSNRAVQLNAKRRYVCFAEIACVFDKGPLPDSRWNNRDLQP